MDEQMTSILSKFVTFQDCDLDIGANMKCEKFLCNLIGVIQLWKG